MDKRVEVVIMNTLGLDTVVRDLYSGVLAKYA
jgi:hypothetical protein